MYANIYKTYIYMHTYFLDCSSFFYIDFVPNLYQCRDTRSNTQGMNVKKIYKPISCNPS